MYDSQQLVSSQHLQLYQSSVLKKLWIPLASGKEWIQLLLYSKVPWRMSLVRDYRYIAVAVPHYIVPLIVSLVIEGCVWTVIIIIVQV